MIQLRIESVVKACDSILFLPSEKYHFYVFLDFENYFVSRVNCLFVSPKNCRIFTNLIKSLKRKKCWLVDGLSNVDVPIYFGIKCPVNTYKPFFLFSKGMVYFSSSGVTVDSIALSRRCLISDANFTYL